MKGGRRVKYNFDFKFKFVIAINSSEVAVCKQNPKPKARGMQFDEQKDHGHELFVGRLTLALAFRVSSSAVRASFATR